MVIVPNLGTIDSWKQQIVGRKRRQVLGLERFPKTM
jgi:hypothetical protein